MADANRLHPASPVFNIARHARTLLIPGVAVLFIGGDSWQLWLMALFVPSALFEVIRFFTFRYRLTDDHLVTTLVFLGSTERSLRYERIQNIESVQSVLHRALGVAEVRIETGAGGKPEAVLRVVPATEVERIRERVFADRRASTNEDTADQPAHKPQHAELYRLRPADYPLLGLITLRGFVLIAIFLGLAWEFDLFDRLNDTRAWLFDRFVGLFPQAGDLAVGLVTATILALGIGALVLASIAWAVLRFGGFRLTRDGDDFRIQAGLLTRVNATVPRHRVQLVRLTQSFQHRRYDRAAISLETAGGVDPESAQESSFGRRWFAPIVRPEDIPRLADNIRPGLSLDAEPWPSLSKRAKRRLLRKNIIITVPIAVAITLITHSPLGLWAIALGAFVGLWLFIHNLREASLARYQRTDDWIACRAGVMTRTTSVAFLDRVQVIQLTQSPFDRRANMTTLRIDTAGGLPMSPRVDLPMLDTDQAHDYARAVAKTAEATGFVW